MEVTDVIDEGDRIAHLVDGAAGQPLSPGSLVECRIDWDRRHDHMQQHTGQHLLSAVFVELFGWKTLSFHMGEDTSSVEIATAKLDDSVIDQVERRANRLVSEARPVRISYGSADDAAGLRKPSARTGLLRIIEIEAYDRSACGGTHLRTTAEVGPVQIGVPALERPFLTTDLTRYSEIDITVYAYTAFRRALLPSPLSSDPAHSSCSRVR